MPFIYVVGVAGSGKSAIAKALGQHGYSAYDEDAPKVGAAHNKQTGQVVDVPPTEERTPEWFDAHEWRVLDETLTDLVARSSTEDIVLATSHSTTKEFLTTLSYLGRKTHVGKYRNKRVGKTTDE